MRVFVLAAVGLALALVPAAHAGSFSPWSGAVNAESLPGTSELLNTEFNDGCPIQSPAGLALYMASNRKRFVGDPRTDLDIWVSRRASTDDPWGAPENLEAVNSTADDFCPTPVRGGGLFFVSRKVTEGVTCGPTTGTPTGDIYFTRRNPTHGWATPRHLGCGPDGPNSALDEQGPSYVEAGDPSLYFSSGPDIFVSREKADGSFGPAAPVAELNSAANDIQPNVRKDGREVVFSSNRPGGKGLQDIWGASRDSVDDPWSAPVNLGDAINTADRSESRPSFSWDGETLYFGRAPAGQPGDIFVATRNRTRGGK